MSIQTLSRIFSGRKKKDKLADMKIGSSATLPIQKNTSKTSSMIIDVNNNAPPLPPRQNHNILNRRGSLPHNSFKGVKKELLEKHANMIVHTLTVSRVFNVSHFHELSRSSLSLSRSQKQIFTVKLFFFFFIPHLD